MSSNWHQPPYFGCSLAASLAEARNILRPATVLSADVGLWEGHSDPTDAKLHFNVWPPGTDGGGVDHGSVEILVVVRSPMGEYRGQGWDWKGDGYIWYLIPFPPIDLMRSNVLQATQQRENPSCRLFKEVFHRREEEELIGGRQAGKRNGRRLVEPLGWSYCSCWSRGVVSIWEKFVVDLFRKCGLCVSSGGSGAASRTLEDQCGACLSMRRQSWRMEEWENDGRMTEECIVDLLLRPLRKFLV